MGGPGPKSVCQGRDAHTQTGTPTPQNGHLLPPSRRGQRDPSPAPPSPWCPAHPRCPCARGEPVCVPPRPSCGGASSRCNSDAHRTPSRCPADSSRECRGAPREPLPAPRHLLLWPQRPPPRRASPGLPLPPLASTGWERPPGRGGGNRPETGTSLGPPALPRREQHAGPQGGEEAGRGTVQGTHKRNARLRGNSGKEKLPGSTELSQGSRDQRGHAGGGTLPKVRPRGAPGIPRTPSTGHAVCSVRTASSSRLRRLQRGSG